jgi:hypothetical protein
MCNTILIQYSCNHLAHFHRSTCRGVFWVRKKGHVKTLHPKVTGSMNSTNQDMKNIDETQDTDTPSRGRYNNNNISESSSSSNDESDDETPPPPPPPNSPKKSTTMKAACRSKTDLVLLQAHPCGPCQRVLPQRRERASTTLRLVRGVLSLNTRPAATRLDFPARKDRRHPRKHQAVKGKASPLRQEIKIEDLMKPLPALPASTLPDHDDKENHDTHFTSPMHIKEKEQEKPSLEDTTATVVGDSTSPHPSYGSS